MKKLSSLILSWLQMVITQNPTFHPVSTTISFKGKVFTPLSTVGDSQVHYVYHRLIVLLSRQIRKPEDWQGKKVIIVGSGQSGTDISVELVDHASEVILIGKGPTPAISDKVKRFEEWIENVTEKGLVTNSGVEVIADVVILASGYKLSFPFLHNILDLDPTR